MKNYWLKYLKDPADGSTLNLEKKSISTNSKEISHGNLISKTKNTYKIVKGVVILLTNKTQTLKSVESFAYEWEQFGFLFAKETWLNDLIKPLVGSDKFFKGKVVVDAGAGAGAQSRWMIEAGARFVFSLELSNVIFTEHAKTIEWYKEKIFPIQCDIANPPLNVKPDVIYCMNVIQHTKNPEDTFLALAELMNYKTIFLFNIYDKDKNPPARLVLIRFIRLITRFLPFPVWKWVSFFCISFLYLSVKIPFLSVLVKRIYPLGKSFKGNWLNLYDLGGAHFYQEYFSESHQKNMIKKAGLKIKNRTKFGYVLTK